MLTPAYALTATERVLPSMALDFTTAVLDPRVTITRALNTATCVNSSKLIETVNANLPRFSYNPVTGASLGLLIEETRANLFLQSNDFATSWSKANGNPSITTDQAISPDGTQNADLFIPNTNTNFQLIFQSPTAAAGTYTCSVFGKKKDYDYLAIGSNSPGLAFSYFNLATGQVYSAGASHTASIQNYGNGFYRCIVTVTTTGANSTFYTGISSTAGSVQSAGDGTSGSYLYGAQLEAGAFATSFIPTTTTSLTRNSDVVSMTGTNFSDWYNASEGTFVASGYSFYSGGADNPLLYACDGTENNVIGIFGVSYSHVVVSAATQASFFFSAPTSNSALYDYVLAYKQNSFQAAYNGAAGSGSSGTIPIINQLQIGRRASGASMNGTIKRVMYYKQRLINNECSTLSLRSVRGA